jgi:tetratricopeptide (TPR) repeat protein
MLAALKKSALFIVFFFGAAMLFAQTTDKDWYKKGMELFDKKQYSEAANAFDKATGLNAQYDKAFYRAGWCYNDGEQYAKAIERLKKAVAINKTYAEAWQELGYAYKKLNLNQEAVASLDKAIEARPTYAMAYKQKGDVYQNMKNYPAAIEAYKKCLDNDAKNEGALYNLGYLSNATEDYVNAVLWLKKALAIKPTVSSYNELGFAFYKQKMNDSAIAAYRSASALDPKNGTAYKGIGDVYRRNYKPAKTDEAMAAYKKAIENNPNSAGSHFGLGWCYNEKGLYSDAVPKLRKSLELDNTLAAACTELGYAQYMTGSNTEALETFKKGIVLDKKNTLCRYYSGLVYIKLKDKINANIMYNELKLIDAPLGDKLLAKINAM